MVRQRDAARRFEPTEHYAELRRRCPLHHEADHDPPFYVVCRFDDVVDVLKHPELWQNHDGPGVFFQENGVLGTTDDPDHARQRRALRAAFVPTVINRLEPEITSITDELLDAVPVVDGVGECDFVHAVAEPLPALAIAELLGVDGDDRDDFRRWSNDAVAALTGGDIDRYTAAKRSLEDYVEAGVRERLALLPDHAGSIVDDTVLGETVPDDVMSRLAIGHHNHVLDEREVRHLGYQLLVAGHETTTSLLGMMLHRLIERPDVMAALRADHSLIPTAIEEALRFDSPVHGLFRTNAAECTIHGETIPPRSKLQVVYASANRDPAHFEDPDEFRLDRERTELGHHVAFGWGIHFCLGAPLARLETRVAFEQILDRWSDIELAGVPERNDSFVLHGLTRLPIRFTATDSTTDTKDPT
jgi:cytochrome P450